ncbi:MAG: hypothetical protein Q7J26_02625 [Brevundimonas sp.]|uniref:hypothetical protein n=1 Tax=Brevundimonas sp. TaxID=1871086 RepID=UPI002720A1D5|nr:hypothetical protein [Brevundimonas sp.]MDO9607394.1 hypothetical protein [Brevundimonas sp.]
MGIRLLQWLEDKTCHRVEQTAEGFELWLLPGKQEEFDELVRTIRDDMTGEFSAFPRGNDVGGFECVHIIVHDPAKFALALKSLR